MKLTRKGQGLAAVAAVVVITLAGVALVLFFRSGDSELIQGSEVGSAVGANNSSERSRASKARGFEAAVSNPAGFFDCSQAAATYVNSRADVGLSRQEKLTDAADFRDACNAVRKAARSTAETGD